ncbi:MAG TPA: hypothetical protein VGN57_09870 [Pirellulaceae bacterium]|jgi:hypothetical protein|nr:hypothetical protein [Pirellulaceae bacterium]
MRSADDPASLSPDERLAELADILAAGVLRLRHQALPDVPTTPPECSGGVVTSPPRPLEVVSETVLSVRAS